MYNSGDLYALDTTLKTLDFRQGRDVDDRAVTALPHLASRDGIMTVVQGVAGLSFDSKH